VVANWHSAKFLTQLGRQLGLVGLLGAIDEQLELFRRSTNSILLADTNELIASVIDSGVQFVYERMGTRIKHYLIDEFQDTSQRQYENFKPLLEDSLDENEGDNFNMLIGDIKQAIYRFRNADPSLFRERVQRDMSRYHPHVEPLDTNYRSLKEIVEFNNALFNEIINRFYKAVAQTIANSKIIQIVRICGKLTWRKVIYMKNNVFVLNCLFHYFLIFSLFPSHSWNLFNKIHKITFKTLFHSYIFI
jgi:ATP-dependent exoDNAse (exonuclease V) beta subunit